MKKAFFEGCKITLPMIPGMVPFGLIVGQVALDAGLTIGQAMFLSIFVFAGAAQLAVLELSKENATAAIMIFTGLIVNARMVIYSAGLAQNLKGAPPWFKAICAYLLTDLAYLTSAGYQDKPNLKWYYFGVALSIWFYWQTATFIGLLLGGVLPESFPLQFSVMLIFIAILAPALKQRPAVISAIAGGVSMLIFKGLPYNMGLIAAILTGGLAGYYAERGGKW